MCCAYPRQPIHYSRNFLLLDHNTDSDPPILLESRDGRGALPGADLGRLGEKVAGDVVLAEYVALGSDDAFDAVGD